MDATYATNCAAMPAFTIDDMLAAMEKMRAIPKTPNLDDVVFVLGDDVVCEESGPCVAFDGIPVRIVRSQYAKGITPLPASLFEPMRLSEFPIAKYEPPVDSGDEFGRSFEMLRFGWTP